MTRQVLGKCVMSHVEDLSNFLGEACCLQHYLVASFHPAWHVHAARLFSLRMSLISGLGCVPQA